MKKLWNFIFAPFDLSENERLKKEIEFELRRSGALRFQINLFTSLRKYEITHPNITKAIDEAHEITINDCKKLQTNP